MSPDPETPKKPSVAERIKARTVKKKPVPKEPEQTQEVPSPSTQQGRYADDEIFKEDLITYLGYITQAINVSTVELREANRISDERNQILLDSQEEQ